MAGPHDGSAAMSEDKAEELLSDSGSEDSGDQDGSEEEVRAAPGPLLAETPWLAAARQQHPMQSPLAQPPPPLETTARAGKVAAARSSPARACTGGVLDHVVLQSEGQRVLL